MDLEVPDRRVRQSAAQVVPGFGSVRGGVNAEVRPTKEDVLLFGVLADDVCRAAGNIGRDIRPGLPVIGRLEDVGREIVVVTADQGDVDAAGSYFEATMVQTCLL